MRAIAVVALIGFASGLVGIVAGDDALTRAGEAVFAIGATLVWLIAMWKVWRKRKGDRSSEPANDRAPLSTALAQAAAQSVNRKRPEE